MLVLSASANSESNIFGSSSSYNLAFYGNGTIVKTDTGWTELDYGAMQGFSGQINVQAGILGNGDGNSTWGASATGMGLSIAPGATVNLRGNGAAVGALSGSGTLENSYNNFATGNGVLTVGLGDASSTFSGSIIGTGIGGNNQPNAGVTFAGKDRHGTLTLTGANTYSGQTTVNAGTLAVNGSLYSTGWVAVQGGALGGTGSVGTVHVYNGGALAPGYTAGAGTLTAASVTLDGGSTLDYTLVSPSSSSNSFLNVAGPLTLPPVGVTTLDVASGGLLGPGTYPLIAYGSISGGGTGALSLGFSLPPGETSTFVISSTSNVIDLVITAPPLTNGQWGVNSGGTWSTATNWSGNNVPGLNPQDTAVFGTMLTSGTADRHSRQQPQPQQPRLQHHGSEQLRDQREQRQRVDPVEHRRRGGDDQRQRRQPHDRRADHAGQQPERDRRGRQHADRQRGDRRPAAARR